jgi:hypothetical protein
MKYDKHCQAYHVKHYLNKIFLFTSKESLIVQGCASNLKNTISTGCIDFDWWKHDSAGSSKKNSCELEWNVILMN